MKHEGIVRRAGGGQTDLRQTTMQYIHEKVDRSQTDARSAGHREQGSGNHSNEGESGIDVGGEGLVEDAGRKASNIGMEFCT